MTVTDYMKHISKLSEQTLTHLQRKEFSAALDDLFKIQYSVEAAIQPLYEYVHVKYPYTNNDAKELI